MGKDNTEQSSTILSVVEKLKKENTYLRNILNLMSDVLFIYDPENDLWALERVLRQRESDLIVDKDFVISNDRARRSVHKDDLDKFDQIVEAMRRGDYYIKGNFRAKEYSNHWLYKEVKAASVKDNGKIIVVGCAKNTSVSRYYEFPDEDKINKDPLTGLLNKAVVTENIYELLQTDIKGALIILDLDNFKAVNDSQGHLFGDEVLINVARNISNLFRYDDLVGRIGGDEFLIFMKDVEDVEEIKRKAEQLCKVVADIYVGEKNDLSISASVGITLVPRDGKNFNTLFDKADNAMYYSKNNGKNNYTIYDEHNKAIRTGGRNKININRATHGKYTHEEAYTTYNKNNKSEVSKFTYELTDFTLKLMEDTTDIDSAINLLLRKVKNYFNLCEVSIYSINTEKYTLECEYRYIDKENRDKNTTYKKYTAKTWNEMIYSLKKGYLYSQVLNKKNGCTYSRLTMPMYIEKKFVGYIEFVKPEDNYTFAQEDMDVFKSFSRIITVYSVSAKAFAATSDIVEKMDEIDALTGLYKYEKFQDIVKKSINELPEDKTILLVYSDINHFKVVNENYGYAVGDDMLKKFAEYISEPDDGKICHSRAYSDNFVSAILINKNTSSENITDIINQINRNMENKLQQNFFDNKIVINSGMYVIKDKDEELEKAITNANLARKEAKKSKSHSAMMFDDVMMEEIRKDIRYTSSLPKAITNNEICVYYQPKTECGSTNIIGAEALVRWKKQDGTMIYPDEFIPVFEKNGAIIEVDYYVYECVFRYISQRLNNNQFVVPVSLNVSRAHLETTGFIEYIKLLFSKYDVPPEYIEFELTEGIYIRDMNKVLELNAKLKEIGTKVSMDDFGSGYSSLTLLNNLPIDIIKIDKSLMRNKVLTESDEVIVGSVVNMAKKLSLKVICEGVETEEQSKFLSRVGCDVIQGYYYSKPLPEDDFNKYMEAHRYAQIEEIKFSFNDNLYDDSHKYKGTIVGKNVVFTDGPVKGMRALKFPGGEPGINVLELPTDVYTSKSYSVAMWVFEEEKHLWTSAMYTVFENGFTSIMPSGWEMTAVFRIKHDDELKQWFDAGGRVKLSPGWNYVVATYDASISTGRLFVNGIRAGIIEDTPDLYLAGRVIVGGDIYQPSLVGKVADLRFYNAPLTALQIEKEYNKIKEKMDI